jgi:mono/diheme cytochrome c family protein
MRLSSFAALLIASAAASCCQAKDETELSAKPVPVSEEAHSDWKSDLTEEQLKISETIFAETADKPPFLIVPINALLEGKSEDDAAQIRQGHETYQHWCSACHGFGQHTPGTMALYFKYNGEMPPPLEMRPDLDAELLSYFVRNGISMMPSFRPTEISDEDIEAMAAYLKESSAFFAKQQPPEAQ